MNIRIRQEHSNDISVINDVTIQAFKSIEFSSHTEQFIVRALRDAGVLTLSLVAEIEGEVVAHIAISPVNISSDALGWYGLGPVSVLPKHQGLGIGSKLIVRALEQLKELGANGCVLLGEPAYYQRFGFEAKPELILEGVPPQYFQALTFNGETPQGKVAYHSAFNATS